MKKSSLKKIKIKKVEKYLKKNQYIDICNIIKNENAISIIAKFSFEILIKYLKICSKSKKTNFTLAGLIEKLPFSCKVSIWEPIVADKPSLYKAIIYLLLIHS